MNFQKLPYSSIFFFALYSELFILEVLFLCTFSNYVLIMKNILNKFNELFGLINSNIQMKYNI